MSNSPTSKLHVIRWIVLSGVLLVLAAFLWFATRPQPLTVQGEVSANRVDVSPRVNGRVSELGVDVGDNVKRGVLLAQLESPQLSASLIAARAALAVARADYDRVYSTRPETIAARKADLAAAEADVVLTQEEYGRQAHLITTGFTHHTSTAQSSFRQNALTPSNVRPTFPQSSRPTSRCDP